MGEYDAAPHSALWHRPKLASWTANLFLFRHVSQSVSFNCFLAAHLVLTACRSPFVHSSSSAFTWNFLLGTLSTLLSSGTHQESSECELFWNSKWVSQETIGSCFFFLREVQMKKPSQNCCEINIFISTLHQSWLHGQCLFTRSSPHKNLVIKLINSGVPLIKLGE